MFAFVVFSLAATATVEPLLPRYADVRIGIQMVRVPFPDGFCLPTGQQAANTQVLAKADASNVTHLYLVVCDVAANETSDYLMMQTPVGALTLDKSRAEFLNWLGQGLPNGQAPITIDNKTISGAVSEQLSNLADEPVTVDSALALRSRDDVCVYMGGTATTTIGDTAVTQSVSGCASVAGRRPFNLFAYSNSKNPSGYKALQPMLRRWALSIRQIK